MATNGKSAGIPKANSIFLIFERKFSGYWHPFTHYAYDSQRAAVGLCRAVKKNEPDMQFRIVEYSPRHAEDVG